MKAQSFFFLFAIILSSCAPAVYTQDSYDEFGDTYTLEMKNNKIKSSESLLEGLLTDYGKEKELELNLEYQGSPGKENQLFVIAEIELINDYFMIGPGRSLVLLVDGKRFELETDGEFDSEMGLAGSSLKTRKAAKARYPMDVGLLQKIIGADTVKVRLLAYEANAEERDKKGIEGMFQPFNFEAWQEFYQQMQKAQAAL